MIIYWHRFVPRLFILAVIAFIAWLNQETLITLAVQQQLESRTGAGVQLESIRGDLLKGNAVANNLSVYDRKNPSRKPLCATKITAEGDFKNIAKRYLVFPKITAEGIQITVDGVDGQQFIPDKRWMELKNVLPKNAAAIAGEIDWTIFFSQKPEDAVKQIIPQLKTSMLANQLNTKWADDVKKIEISAKDIENRFQVIKQILNKQNLDDTQTPQVQQFLTELNAISGSVQKFLSDVNQLNEKAKFDYQSLLTSVNQDRDSIKKIPLPKFSTDGISKSLIGPEVKEQWDNMLTWSEWLRSLLSPDEVKNNVKNNAKNNAAEQFSFSLPKHFSGETINFAALDARPDVLIEMFDFTGKIDFGTVPLFFNCKAQNTAFSMQLAPAPTIIQCCFSGRCVPVSPIQTENDNSGLTEIDGGLPDIFITAGIDRIGQNEIDNLVFHCPKYRLPARLLGNQGQFAVAVSPGISQLDGMFTLNRGQLSGRIRIIQTETKLSAVLPTKMQNTGLHKAIQNTLNSLNGFNAEIFVSGTKDAPQYIFKSDIADKICPSLEQLLQMEWDGVKQLADTQITAEANAAVDILRTAVNNKINPLTAQINAEQQQWQQKLQEIPLEQLNGKKIEDAVKKEADKLQKKLPGLLDKYLNK